MSVGGGCEIDTNSKRTEATRPNVEYGDAGPAVCCGDIGTTSPKEVHPTPDGDQAGGGSIDLCNNAVSTLARISQVKSSGGEPHQLSSAWQDRVVRTDTWRDGFRGRW